MVNLKNMLTTGEVAGIFDVHPGTVRRWCRQGMIRHYRFEAGASRGFRREDVAIAYLDRAILKCLRGDTDSR